MLSHLRSLLSSRRHVAALVAAIALSQALGIPNALACEQIEDARVEHSRVAMGHAMAAGGAPDAMPPGSECDTTPHPSCPPASESSCALMSGCMTPAIALAAGPIPAFSVTPLALVKVILQHELRRSTAPEPPPPRA